ncbi:hypothetical protein BDZ45DRAFT_161989 [Acephala macrosclerotiorum]|nr:hypothetical protein BDZ45DRAFT_161989 [Acephala macrosclerotiorum]
MAAGTGLSSFPAELLVLITNYLPAESSAAFALSSRGIRDKLGSKSWDALRIPTSQLESVTRLSRERIREARRDRHALLCLYERDLPSHILCEACQKLHKVDTSLVGQPWFQELCCMRKDREENIQKSIYETFRYPIFQMLMKRHRLGLDCTDLLNYLRYNITEPRTDHTYHCTAEARIISDALYVRAQQVFTLPLSLLPDGPQTFGISACPHFTSDQTQTFVSGKLSAIFRRRIHHLPYCHGPHCTKCFLPFLCCMSCQTEFQIDIKDLGESGIALVLTKWQALGKGLDSWDPIWLRFTNDHGAIQLWDSGSISHAFENGKPFRFDSILPQLFLDKGNDIPSPSLQSLVLGQEKEG